MSLSSEDFVQLAARASEAARRAGRLVSESRPEAVEHKASGVSEASRVVTEVDRLSQELILGILGPSMERFDLGLLTEECVDDRSRLESDFFWCIDPLDGTLPFVESKSGYAISIALVSRDGIPKIGVVFDPVEESLYCAIRGQGVTCNEVPWSISQVLGETLRVLADRSFNDMPGRDSVAAELAKISQEMGLQGVDLRVGAGAVMNACGVLAHAPACYFKFPKPHEGGGSLWDFAATACLFHEAGAVAVDIHGDRLDLNRHDSTFMNHRGVIFASDEELARRIMALYLKYAEGPPNTG